MQDVERFISAAARAVLLIAFSIVFSLFSAGALLLAVAEANEWGDAPGGGFLISGMLGWALLSAMLAAALSSVQAIAHGGPLRIVIMRLMIAVTVLNGMAAELLCLTAAHDWFGWMLFACLLAGIGLCVWLFFGRTRLTWVRRAAVATAVPFAILTAAVCCVNIAGGRTLVQRINPDGTIASEVNRSGLLDRVLLKSRFSPFRTCIFAVPSSGKLRVTWTDGKN